MTDLGFLGLFGGPVGGGAPAVPGAPGDPSAPAPKVEPVVDGITGATIKSRVSLRRACWYGYRMN